MEASPFSTLQNTSESQKTLETINEKTMFVLVPGAKELCALPPSAILTTQSNAPLATMDNQKAAAAAAAWMANDKSGYKDHSNDPDAGNYMACQGGTTTDQSFPVRLHYALSEIEQDGLSSIVGWAPHGRSFVVHKPKVFTEQVLGNWFRMSKYASFQRQLNIYGFQRLTTGPEKGGYYHELFLRTKPGLASRIQRHKVKGTGTRKAASPELEPDFYRMPALPFNRAAAPATMVAQQPQSKIGVLVTAAGPQAVCASTAAAASAAGGIKCSLRSLAPMLLSDPQRPSVQTTPVTTGFSVYSSGAAMSRQQPARGSFTTATNSSAAAAASQQQGLIAAASDAAAAASHQNRILTFAAAPFNIPTLPPNTHANKVAGLLTTQPSRTTTAPKSSRSSGYVGPLVHPLLRESSPKTSTGASTTGAASKGFFTSIMSASNSNTPGTTSATGQAKPAPKYEYSDFSGMWFM